VMAVVLVGGSLINAIWQAIWYFRLVGTSFVIDPKLIGEIVRTNIPFLIAGVLGVGYTSIDTILLSLMANSTVVGLYGAAARVTDMMSFLPNIVIMNIMYPVFSKLATTSDAGLKLALEKSMNIMLFCSIPITTILVVAAPNIIGFLYGSGFALAVPALQALAPYVVFLYINYALLVIILSKKQDRTIPIASGVALAFNLGLNLVLIPLFQQIGAAMLTSFTELLLCCIAVFVIPRHLLPLGSLRVAFKALIASLLMAMVILPLHTLHIFVILPIAMLVYFGASLLLGTIPREDYLSVYYAIRQKRQSTSSSGIGNVPETLIPAYYPDTLCDVESVITMKLPAIRLQPLPETLMSSYTDTLFAYESAITRRLPAIRPQTMQQRSLKAIRLQPMRPHARIQQEQRVTVSEEFIDNQGSIVG
jgi:peptidoglycan biosynthesis protein MviN/MurJ (putative lipid II flippase)